MAEAQTLLHSYQSLDPGLHFSLVSEGPGGVARPLAPPPARHTFNKPRPERPSPHSLRPSAASSSAAESRRSAAARWRRGRRPRPVMVVRSWQDPRQRPTPWAASRVPCAWRCTRSRCRCPADTCKWRVGPGRGGGGEGDSPDWKEDGAEE